MSEFGARSRRAEGAAGAWRSAAVGRVPVLGALVAVDTDAPVVALTFDDGPDPSATPALLDVLGEAGARATFFTLGERISRDPELARRAVAEGHAVGTHGWHHRSMVLDAPEGWRAAAQWRRENVSRGARAVVDVVGAGHGRVLYRPAYGHQDVAVRAAARVAGCDTVGWSLSAGDWQAEDGPTIARRVVDGVRPGAIVLLHDGLADAFRPECFDRAPTVDAVGRILDELGGRARFVTVPELLACGSPRRRVRHPKPRPGSLPTLTGADVGR
jgi:peptidoglycan/xylan/chitin deacetylase (PgdA/CDA1 family)